MGGDEFLQAQKEEVHLEILPEIRVFRVIAVTENNLVSEEIAVMIQFFLNIRELRIELVVLGTFRRAQIAIFVCHNFMSPLKNKTPDAITSEV